MTMNSIQYNTRRNTEAKHRNETVILCSAEKKAIFGPAGHAGYDDVF